MIVKVRFIGTGGQGNVLAAHVLGDAAVRSGYNAVQTSMYSAQVRGAPTRADVIISDEEIFDIRAEDPDYLVAMSQDAVMAFRNLKPRVVVAEEHILNIPYECEKIHKIHAIKISKELGSISVQNMVFLGFLIRVMRVIDIKVVEESIRDIISPKWVEIDVKALRRGWDAAGNSV
ncbi:MAG: 2-oxoacid:acceptor oxidoreductase family protein [Euryarchaeota archaeon]|nr:2-oxoacid:acceptor oxidoreductase family protein [Euryarchaeota archaeon]MCD6158039.1 2-oxoacid:acceptor oxidoreductase family protein [Euryarchaeota archaeon]